MQEHLMLQSDSRPFTFEYKAHYVISKSIEWMSIFQ